MDLNTVDNSGLVKNKTTLLKPVVLVLLDSWGVGPLNTGNTFFNLKLKTFSSLIKNYPTALLNSDYKSAADRYASLGASGDLSKYLSLNGFSQLNLCESEKLILAWHYFNGKREKLLNGEELKVVSSIMGERQDYPAQVLPEIIKIALRDIKKGLHDFLIINLSNLDLISATGNLKSAKEAAKILDKNLGRLVSTVLKQKGVLIISAAYGHAEAIINPVTELAESGISKNPVPFIIVGQDYQGKNIGLPEALDSDLSLVEPAGTLNDLAPTILKILNIIPESELPGKSLI